MRDGIERALQSDGNRKGSCLQTQYLSPKRGHRFDRSDQFGKPMASFTLPGIMLLVIYFPFM